MALTRPIWLVVKPKNLTSEPGQAGFMLYKHTKHQSDKLSGLPKKLEREAKQTSTFHKYSFKPNFKTKFEPLNLLKLPKFFLGVYLLLFFLGYQPTIGLPPIKKVDNTVFAQEQTINSNPIPYTFNLPHPGYVSTKFSTWHPGVDIATGLGMSIKPIAPGKVVDVSYGFIGLGHSVVLEHEGGYRSTYGHMGTIFVKVDDTVNESSLLGQVGMTGRTTGPHTHLEVTKDGKSIDPLTILPAIDKTPGEAYYQAKKSVENLPQNQLLARPKITPKVVVTKVEPPNLDPKINLKAELAFDL